ncbi:MAG: sodium/proline symporter, partial [Gammaproteobacteria bacterium]
MTLSFLGFLLMFVLIGVSSVWFSRHTRHDYYLASHSMPPWLVALSAVATNNSGYMFIGVIGYTYTVGFAAVWLMTGWILGDFVASLLIHQRLRLAAGASGEGSYAGVLSHWSGGSGHRHLQIVASLISLLFLLAYAGAQLLAGGKALHVLFDWPQWGGAVMGAVMVVAYCFAGGIRASIWTDAAQSMVMVVAMGLMLVVATAAIGGIDGAMIRLQAIDGFLDISPGDMFLPGLSGVVLFTVGWMFAGFSIIGQPHIMVRFMTLTESGSMIRVRCWYYGWFIIFYCMATGVGMLSRIYLSDPGSFDAELALPTMALELLPPVLVGLVLAGIFAATMSTADSLVLSCSAALTHDLLPHRIEKTWLIKIATVLMTGLALGWALFSKQTVFSLVIMSWSGLGSAFGPLMLVLAFGARPAQRTLIAMALTGFGTALVWRWLGWHEAVYEGMPGILAGLLV